MWPHLFGIGLVSIGGLLSAANLLDKTQLTLAQLSNLVKANNSVLLCLSIGSIVTIWSTKKLVAGDNDEISKLRSIERKLRTANQDKLADELHHVIEASRTKSHWAHTAAIIASLCTMGGIVYYLVLREKGQVQLQNRVHDLEEVQLKLKENVSKLRLTESTVQQWESIFEKYLELPSGTSVAVIQGDKALGSNTVYAAHTWGLLGGDWSGTDEKAIRYGDLRLLHSNRFSWGVGNGISLSLDRAFKCFENYGHGAVVQLSQLQSSLKPCYDKM